MIAVATTSRTIGALRDAAADARRGWNGSITLRVGLVAAAGAAVAFLPDVRVVSAAGWLYLALAAIGLAFSVGVAGMPLLSQGAFMGIGAFAAALVRARAGWPVAVSVPLGVAAAVVAGSVVGAGVVRLRPVYVAAASWVLAWLVLLALLAFPGVSGGAEGLVLPRATIAGLELTPRAHYLVALALVAATALVFGALRTAPIGLGLSAFDQNPAAAVALGVPAGRFRLSALVLSAGLGGLAGSLTVELAQVADPSQFGPFLSFQLLAAVLLGGAARALGAAVGVAALAALASVAGVVASVERLPSERFDAAIAALLLLAALSLGGKGVVPFVEARRRRPSAAAFATARVRPPDAAGRLRARGLTKRYGELVALDGFDLDVEPGSVRVLVGPNGSGKTTALRLLAGTIRPDAGSVELAGRDVTPTSVRERVEAGVVRTLQSTAVFPDLSALENVLVGASIRRRHGGTIRSALATPKSRAEAMLARERALETLALFGLVAHAGRPAAELSALERRLLMLATAVATRPSVLLVDELAAGAAVSDMPRLVSMVERLRDAGLAIVLVEHNVRLVRSLADHVVALDAGRVVATGTADEVAKLAATHR